MTLAFALYKYFPFGGLQRDFLRIAKECQSRGHSIRVYTYSWQGDIPAGFDVRLLPKKGFSSQSRNIRFSAALQQDLQIDPVDLVVGFNKMPGLDVYYAADGCYEQRVRDLYVGLRAKLYRMAGRYRHFSEYEAAVFSKHEKTQVLMISDQQQDIFQRIYSTPLSRLHMLPPGIARDRCAPDNAADIRADFRAEFKLGSEAKLLLMVGSGFKTKGVDRSIRALANLPLPTQTKTRLFIIGQDRTAELEKLADSLGVADKVTFLSGRDDVPRFLLGADVLVHPARHENTGTVLLEALVAGLPVLCSSVCGYARYIRQADAGRALSEGAFVQAEFEQQLAVLLSDETDLEQLSRNGLSFAAEADLYSMPERAADIIEDQIKVAS